MKHGERFPGDPRRVTSPRNTIKAKRWVCPGVSTRVFEIGNRRGVATRKKGGVLGESLHNNKNHQRKKKPKKRGGDGGIR